MEIKQDYKYLQSHEWVRVEDNKVFVGLSSPACEMLGEIIYVEVPEMDKEVIVGDEVCTVESVKAASSIYAPVSGLIVDVNEELEDAPEMIQEDPYDVHIYVIEMSDPTELEQLLDADTYEEFIGEHR